LVAGPRDKAMSFFLKPAQRGRAISRLAPVLSVILVGGSIASSALANDTERLANCVTAADIASAAQKSREAGVTSKQALAIATEQRPGGLKNQTSSTVTEVYDDSDRLTPDQAAAKALLRCFESDVL
jgi:hypothetical protein